MSQGADEFSDAGLKPFKIPGSPGDPARVVQPTEHSLDEPNVNTPSETPEETQETEETQEAPPKEEIHGRKAVENYAAKIQEHSEQLYETLSYRAKTEKGFLDTLLSGDKLDKKMAQKILERNPEHFKAKTLDDYIVNREKEKAGSDPVAQGLAEIRARQAIMEQKQKKEEWEDFKSKNQVSGEFAKMADTVHSEHPDMPYGLVVAAAKGLLKETPTRKETTTAGFGAVNAPANPEQYVPRSAFGKALIRKVNVKEVTKFAKDYYKDS